MTHESIATVEPVPTENRQVIGNEIAEILGISPFSPHYIIHGELKLNRCMQRGVPTVDPTVETTMS